MSIRFLSVCSGIEAASVAWHPLGWRAAAVSDIEPFPRAVLRHHYPDVPLHGRDQAKGESFEAYAEAAGFQTIEASDYGPIDLLVGGTPCQSFSVAGQRGGMADGRGNLALEYIRLADRKRPRWLVWENVPGVFSSNGGEDFRCFLSGLVRWSVPIPAGGWSNGGIIAAGPVDGAFGVAWRILDAQYFGLAQRRKRLFVVGYIGDWRRAAAVLFERSCLSGHPAPRRETGQKAGPTLSARTKGGGGLGTDTELDGGLVPAWPAEVCPTLDTYYGDKLGLEDQHVFNQRGGKFVQGQALPDAIPILEAGARTGISTDDARAGIGVGEAGDAMFTLQAGKQHAVAFSENQQGHVWTSDVCQALNKGGGKPGQGCPAIAIQDVSGRDKQQNGRGWSDDGTSYTVDTAASQGVATDTAVRRLTPRECERLQGFPDDYTLIPVRGKPAADGPRYKALGNSMAVPVMAFIGQRIQTVEELRLNDARPGEAA